MIAEEKLIELIQQLLEEDARVALVLAEIIGPPPGLGASPPRLWEDPDREINGL